MGLIRCGTCAWGDHEEFYPAGVKPAERLSYYARFFPLVEVDSTYYSLQPQRNFALWAERTPQDFVFNVKAYRALTKHDRAPRPGEENRRDVFAKFRFSLEPLMAAGKLKAVHFQFPPWFTCQSENVEYLSECREFFPDQLLAFEFRHASWLAEPRREATLQLLRRLAAVNTVCDEPQVGSGCVPWVPAVTNPHLAIVRLHGRNAGTWYIKDAKTTADRFDYLYSRDELAAMTGPVAELASAAAEVHVLLNNNRSNYAVRNALDMMDLLDLPRPQRDEQGLPVDAQTVPVARPRQSTLF